MHITEQAGPDLSTNPCTDVELVFHKEDKAGRVGNHFGKLGVTDMAKLELIVLFRLGIRV